MLLSIDNKKIEEELKSAPPSYVVSAAYWEPETAATVEIPPADAQSAINVIPPDVEAARERLMTLRQRAIDSGMRLVAFDGLKAIIDETRGR
jgi:hypothetical protein